MTRDEFDALVRRLEERSRAHPSKYAARVLGLLSLGYGYLALVMLVSLALVIGTIYAMISIHNAAVFKLGWVLIVVGCCMCWTVLRGLWVRLEPPRGLRITRADAPQLFALLDELRTTLDCRPFQHVLLDGDYNAAVVQIPRLGVFGWHQNYLLLGLPLMQSLGPDEFKAVLAHEFAHSSRGHGRFGNWLYRLRMTWERIFEHMAQRQSNGGFVLTKFIRWYWPLFNAHAFVLARANEYEADACSVRLAGADAAAGALTRLPVDGAHLSESFWPKIYSLANEQKEPPADVMLALLRALEPATPRENAARSLRQAFLAETTNGDTHPCLKDRLRAFDRLPKSVPPAVPAPPAQSAAKVLLGAYTETAARQLSEQWRNWIAPHWSERHARTRQLATELAPAEPGADADALWIKAQKLMELHDDSAALPALDQVLAADPRHAPANFVKGRALLENDDPRGVELVETAARLDPSLTADACNLLYGHYTRTGQREKLRPIEDRMDRFQEEAALAANERCNVTTRDTFLAHELNDKQLAEVREIVEGERDIGAVAVARKQVVHFPESASFVIAVRVKVSWWKPRSERANQKLVDRVVEKLRLPGQFLVLIAEKNLRRVAKKIFALPGSVIYERVARN